MDSKISTFDEEADAIAEQIGRDLEREVENFKAKLSLYEDTFKSNASRLVLAPDKHTDRRRQKEEIKKHIREIAQIFENLLEELCLAKTEILRRASIDKFESRMKKLADFYEGEEGEWDQ